jgi:hypothetical protein
VQGIRVAGGGEREIEWFLKNPVLGDPGRYRLESPADHSIDRRWCIELLVRPSCKTVMHCHVHVIPRYHGDTKIPAAGVRGVIPRKRDD